MLREARIPLNPAEHDAVDSLISKNPGEPVSMTRRDAGETGPLLIHVGADSYLVRNDGHARKQRRTG